MELLSTQSLESEGKNLVDSWYATEVPLLRRIAIYGVRIGNCWTADEKSNGYWISSSSIHFTSGMKRF